VKNCILFDMWKEIKTRTFVYMCFGMFVYYTCMCVCRYVRNTATKAIYVQCHIKGRSRNHCCRGQAISITYSECVSVALVIQHAKRMRCIILSSVACMVLQYVCTLSYKRHDFWKKLLNIKFLLDYLCKFVSNISHSKKKWEIYYYKVHRSSCRVTVILVRLTQNQIFSTYYRKILKYKISRKSVQWERIFIPCRWKNKSGIYLQRCLVLWFKREEYPNENYSKINSLPNDYTCNFILSSSISF
jgi:hypothetical protein